MTWPTQESESNLRIRRDLQRVEINDVSCGSLFGIEKRVIPAKTQSPNRPQKRAELHSTRSRTIEIYEVSEASIGCRHRSAERRRIPNKGDLIPEVVLEVRSLHSHAVVPEELFDPEVE